ncbi:tRNA (adenosine(37)-N6)-threonylcarbamoyltransferase complex ATPase subunit type 1 TsaE [Legionella maioricensis]|uniref:tRNA threonylcarbamoyladenosine biosynthesis protein TsaE n=1 Tax=Legionella maioricensis TaxID=2896528 RepID=A0A9X2D289_9GAMM|nr:tRNA (adenosine(37)-N6)-threonylcarbamoyltransferase complex ATPase subunit type 1 TsaE [Legionella maioricensis]MCL9685194.1 tRNA (adenosine(37)-N6)-threonylcarbamoyltransferase complex ATPase subunit type 1 TsaE [Legionella maioricensis]MCL9688411.1 tRNA (adenosine(37)-N6)-threonylcarbamoyltransferase complex ATPase subunit type 1 TsaE [Legionella maioricensis]
MNNSGYDKIITLELINEKASEQFATQLASCLSAPLIVTLSGDIGAGKTTIVRAMLKGLGVQSAIKSPTFSLVESYFCRNLHIHHFDLYRIHHEDELEYLGFRDYFSNENICFIEWAENAGKALPQVDIRFNLSIKGAGRNMQITASSGAGKRILACLAGEQ